MKISDNICVIEFVGMPGVGKSSILENNLDHHFDCVFFSSNNLIWDNNNYKCIVFYNYIKFIICKNQLLFGLIKHLFISNELPISYSSKRIHYLILKYIKIYRMSKLKRKNIILDQGILQWVWSLYYDTNDKKLAIDLFEFLDKNDGIASKEYVFLYCDVNENIKRIMNRNKDCRFKQMEEKELRNTILKGNKFIEMLMEGNKCQYTKYDTSKYDRNMKIEWIFNKV